MSRFRPALLLSSALLLTGCGLTSVSRQAQISTPTSANTITGNVHGGNQPVSSATVQLWETGLTGYGAATPSQLGTSVTSDASGNTWVANGTGTSITSIPQDNPTTAGYASHSTGSLNTSPISQSKSVPTPWLSDTSSTLSPHDR